MPARRCVTILTIAILLLGGAQFRAPQAAAAEACFTETNKCIRGRFFAYWQANGGLAQFGYPLTEIRTQKIGACPTDPARECRVQYFERARFEYHPENAAPYDILLGQFGRDILSDNANLTEGFGRLYLSTERVREGLGRPGSATLASPGATQAFERGRMVYDSRVEGIYIFCEGARYGELFGYAQLPYVPDTWEEGQEAGGGPAPTPGLFFPQRGFGKVWRESSTIRDCLGYALTATERGHTVITQVFERGLMLSSETGEAGGRAIYVLYTRLPCNGCSLRGSWERYAGPAR